MIGVTERDKALWTEACNTIEANADIIFVQLIKKNVIFVHKKCENNKLI